jgi:hypothetical protein
MERAAWTDERLDALAQRTDAGFDRVDRDIRDLRGEMVQRFTVVDQRFTSLEGRFETRFNSLETTIRWFGGSMIVGMVATFVAVVLGAS